MGDQVGDRTHLQAVLARANSSSCGRRAILPSAFMISTSTPAGSSPASSGEVAGGFGVAGAGQHAARLCGQRKMWPGCDRSDGFASGRTAVPDGMRAVVGADAGGDAFGGLDAHREVGLELRGIGLHHRRQAELRAALAGQRQADQAARVGDHEIDVGRAHQLRRP